MCNGRTFPAWQAASLRHLVDVPGVEVALLIVSDGEGRPSRIGRLRDVSRLLWILFNKGYVERRSRASRSVDLTDDLIGVPELVCRTEPVGKYAERFTEADLEAIEGHELDVILRFGFGILKGGILDASRYGVWSFHHGDEREFRGQPPGFWELVEAQPVVGSILQRLTERLDGGIVLHRGFFKATLHSYRRTRDEAFLGSAVWPSIVVRQILLGDTGAVDANPSRTEAPIRRQPTNGVVLAFVLRQALAFVRAQVGGLLRAAKWTVGVADAPIHAFLGGVPAIRWLDEQPGSRYLADPFGIEWDGRIIALTEDYDHATHRGVISMIDVTDESGPVEVLDTGVHASYPFLFTHDGEVFCVPETYQAGEVRLYRALDFPTRWQLVGTLIEGFPALDPTVFQHAGRWWLTCTNRDDGPNTKLLVFHAPALEGPWEAHPLNPVKTDVRSARPAGTPFMHDGHLHRPAQDTSESYGGGISINRIDVLTPARFSEQIVARITPSSTDRYGEGIHTLSSVGHRTLVDGRREAFEWSAARRELVSRLKKLLR